MVKSMAESAPQSLKPHRTLTPALIAVMWMVTFGFGTFFLHYATLVPIGQRLGLTAVSAGSILTTMMVAVVAIQPLVPALHRKLGSRWLFLVALGLLAGGFGLMLVPFSPFVSLLIGSMVAGLGFGLLVVLGTAVVPSTVASHRLGKALGFYGVATATATALGAPLGLWLLSVVSQAVLRWLCIGLVVIAVPAVLAIPRRTVTSQAGPHSAQQDHAPAIQDVNVTGLLGVLFPTAIVLTVLGLVLAFGPADGGTSPALYIAAMQVFVIIGRFLASASLDRYPSVTVMFLGVLTVLLGLTLGAFLSAGWLLIAAMVVVGFGTGSVQAASLLMAFEQSGSPHRGSVAWNMTFDIGLSFAGLVGGLGFTYWGAQTTYLVCAGGLAVAIVVFSWTVRGQSSGKQTAAG